MSKPVFLTDTDKARVLDECFDKQKVVLVCPRHNFSYGDKRQPTPGCKDCHMVSFMGLLCATPPNRRLEVVEMLEESVRNLCQAEDEGRIDATKLFARPEVTIEREDGSLKHFNPPPGVGLEDAEEIN